MKKIKVLYLIVFFICFCVNLVSCGETVAETDTVAETVAETETDTIAETVAEIYCIRKYDEQGCNICRTNSSHEGRWFCTRKSCDSPNLEKANKCLSYKSKSY